MSSVKILNMKNVQASIKRKIEQAMSDVNLLNQIGETVVKDNRSNARLGKDPDKKRWSKQLAKSSIKSRKQLAEHNSTSEFYGPTKNNLTFSGQLLNAIAFKAMPHLKQISILFENNTRTPYKTKAGKAIKAPTNSELYDIHKDKRPFIGVGEALRKRIVNLTKSYLRRNIRKS